MIMITMTSFIRLFSLILVLFTIGCVQKEDKQKIINDPVAAERQEQKKPATRPANSVLAPDFTLQTINGKFFSLNEFMGKVIILNFWATWCFPCRMEIPDFIKLYDKYHDNGLEIVGVTIDSGTPDAIASFAESWEMNYTILTDIQGQETQLVTLQYSQATGRPITGVPTTFIIDRDGYIVKMYIGPQSEKILYRDLKPYI